MWVGAWGAAGRSRFLLFIVRGGNHKLFVVEAVPLLLGLNWQNVWNITEAEDFTLVAHLLFHLNVHTLVEGALSTEVIEVELRFIIADGVFTLALLVKFLLNIGKLAPLDEV